MARFHQAGPMLLSIIPLTLLMGLTACAEPDEQEVVPPEVAEIEVEDEAFEPLDFEAVYPIGDEDVGETILLSGTVIGEPGPAGFFVRAEGNRVLFVESNTPVTLGDEVTATGPLAEAEIEVFEGWEADLLGDPDPEWETVELYYVDAATVSPL